MALGIGQSAIAASNFSEHLALPAINSQASGSTFVLFSSCPPSTVLAAPTDNKGNIWPATPNATVLFNASTAQGSLWVLPNGVGGAGHVVTLNYTGFEIVVGIVIEITGGAALDQILSTPNITNAVTANSPPITPTVNGAPVLAFLGGISGGVNVSITDPTGYNNIIQANGNGATNGNAIGAASGFIQTTAAPTNDIFTLTNTPNVGTMTASFIPSVTPTPEQPWQQSGGMGTICAM